MDNGVIIVSILNMLTFVIVLTIAYLKADTTSIALLVGVVASNTTTTVSYWLGSSRGSQRKDDTIAALRAKE